MMANRTIIWIYTHIIYLYVVDVINRMIIVGKLEMNVTLMTLLMITPLFQHLLILLSLLVSLLRGVKSNVVARTSTMVTPFLKYQGQRLL